MQIKSYINAGNIEEKYLSPLAKRQAECWGAKPFEEYKICKNNECKALFSTEEVLGSVLKIRSPESSSIDFTCTECGDETREIYEQEKFMQLMKEYFLGEVSAALIVDEKDSIEGFGVISKTTIKGVVENEFSTRPGSYESKETIKKIGQILYESEESDDKEIICFHQIYASPLVRNSELSYRLLKELFEIHRDTYKNIPLIGEPKYDNKFYPILRSIGWQNITDDQYGYVIQYMKKYSDMLEFLDSNTGFQEFIGDMLRYKKESRDILKRHPEFTGRKFYK